MAYKDPAKKKEYADRYRAVEKYNPSSTIRKEDCMTIKTQTVWNLRGDRLFLKALEKHKLYG